METSVLRSRQQLVSTAVLGCAGALAVLIGAGVYQHPASVSGDGFSALAVTLTAIVVSCLAAVRTLYARAPGVQIALLIGAAAGGLHGLIEMANIAFEYSSYGSVAAHTIAVPASMALMILLFSCAGSLTYERTFSVRLALLSGAWCAVVGTILTGLFGFGFNFIQLAHMVEILRAGFSQSGLTDAPAYVVRNTLEAESTHFLLAPILGASSGWIAGFISSQLREKGRPIAVGLGASSLVLLVSSISLIRFALHLARNDRAPYISCGMLSSALALSCVWPAIWAALLQPRSQPGGRSFP